MGRLARTLVLAALVALGAAGCHTIDSVNPNPAEAGDTITIRGTGLGSTQGSSQVLYDGQPLAIVSWSAARVDAVLPIGKPNGTYAVTVVVNGETSNALTHEIATDTFA